MIGNDIVDLSISPIAKGLRLRRFLLKLFTAREIELIDKSKDTARTIWTLWSIKESVYKIIVRKEKKIRYAPKSVECETLTTVDDHSHRSIVSYAGLYFSSSSMMTGECIHTIAIAHEEIAAKVYSATFDISTRHNEISFLHNEVIKAISDSHSIADVSIKMQKDDLNIPHIFRGEDEVALLSLSHHGRYGAYAYINLESH